MLLLLVFPSFFLNTSQEIGWEERLRNDSFGVEWDVKQQPTNQPTNRQMETLCNENCKNNEC